MWVRWLNEQQEELKARNSARAARYHLSALLVSVRLLQLYLLPGGNQMLVYGSMCMMT